MHRLDLLVVAVGAFVGAVLRYAVGGVVPGVAGTLAANVLGCFALGLLVAAVPRRRVQLLAGTGLLSSFTTYSTFAVETAALTATGAAVNVAANYALGIGAALVGRYAGGRL
jgi:CrcB protein